VAPAAPYFWKEIVYECDYFIADSRIRGWRGIGSARHDVRYGIWLKSFASQCHAIGKDLDRDGRVAPAFAAIARMPSTTAISLEAFLLPPHANMTNYRLTNEQITDLVNYILSLSAD
jgi:hypothetical protein